MYESGCNPISGYDIGIEPEPHLMDCRKAIHRLGLWSTTPSFHAKCVRIVVKAGDAHH